MAVRTQLNSGGPHVEVRREDEIAACPGRRQPAGPYNFYFPFHKMQCGSSCRPFADQVQGLVHLHLMVGLCNPRLSARMHTIGSTEVACDSTSHRVILWYIREHNRSRHLLCACRRAGGVALLRMHLNPAGCVPRRYLTHPQDATAE